MQSRIQVRKPSEVERARHPPVWDFEPRLIYDLISEEQHVQVDRARRLLALPCSPQSALDSLAVAEQLDRRETALQLRHAVEVVRLLLLDLDRLRLVDLRDTEHLLRPAAQCLHRSPQVREPVSQVAPEAHVSPAHPAFRIAHATASASRLARTSCTLKKVAPSSQAITFAATVPGMRSLASSTPVSLPIKLLREAPTRTGNPSSTSESRCLRSAKLCSSVFPNPMPGSRIIFSSCTPAAAACSTLLARKSRTSRTTSSYRGSRCMV